MTGQSLRQPGSWLLASAALRLRRTHPEWAQAMLSEASLCKSERERFQWAWGCWTASLRISFDNAALGYAAALLVGLGMMAAYEWSTDESGWTVIVLALIAASLGALRPRQALLSGAVVGLVVTCVICFEAVSGIRPDYETRAQTFLHSLHWMILLVPALSSAALGAQLRRRFGRSWPSR